MCAHTHTCKVRCRSCKGMAAARDDLAGSVFPSGFSLKEEETGKWKKKLQRGRKPLSIIVCSQSSQLLSLIIEPYKHKEQKKAWM